MRVLEEVLRVLVKAVTEFVESIRGLEKAVRVVATIRVILRL